MEFTTKPMGVVKILLIAIAIYSILALSLSLFASSNWAEEAARERLFPLLEKQWNISISFDGIDPAGFNAITLRNVRLSRSGIELATIDSVLVRIDLARALFMPWRLERSVSKVIFTNPRIAVDESKEEIVQDFSSFSDGEKRSHILPSLDLTVVVRNGELDIAGGTIYDVPIHISNIFGTGKLTESGLVWGLSADNSLIAAEMTSLQGRLEWDEKQSISWNLHAFAAGVDAKSYQEAGIFSIPEVVFTGGTGSIEVTLKGRSGLPVEYMIEVELSEAAGTIGLIAQDVRQVSGKVWYDGMALGFGHLTGRVGESDVLVSGRIWDWKDPNMNLWITGDPVRLEDVQAVLSNVGVAPFSQQNIGISGQIQGTVEISGSVSNPVLRGQISVADGVIDSTSLPEPIVQVHGTMDFTSQNMLVDLGWNWCGGKSSLAGQVTSLFSPILDLHITTDMELSKLAEIDGLSRFLTDLEVSGSLHLTGHVLGLWTDPAIGANVRVEGLRVDGTNIGALTLVGGYKNKYISVSELKIAQPDGGELQLGGFVNIEPARGNTSESFSVVSEYVLGVKLKELDIDSHLLSRIGRIQSWNESIEAFLPQLHDISGSLLVKGTGTDLNRLSLSGNVNAQNVEWRQTDFQRLAAGFVVSSRVFQLDYLHLYNEDMHGEDVVVTGEIVLSPDNFVDAAVDLELQISRLDLADLDLMKDLSGEVGFSGSVRGSLQNPIISGTAKIHSPTWQAYQVDGLEGKMRWENGLLTLSHGLLEVAGDYIHVSGQVLLPTLTGEIRMQTEKASLYTLLSLYDKSITVEGQISGYVDLSIEESGISGYGDLRAAQVTWKGEEISRLAAKVEFTDKILTINQGEIKAFGGTVQAAGTISASGWSMDVDLEDIDVSASKLLQEYNIGTDGIVDGSVTVQGRLKDPKVQGTLAARDVSWQEYHFDRLDGQVGYEDGNVTFDSLYLRRDEGVYALTGRVEIAGNPQMDVRLQLDRGSMHDVLSLLGIAWQGELTGELDGYVHLWGAAQAPTGRLYVSLNNGVFSGTSLEGDLDATLYGRKVQINRLRLEHGQGLVVGSGILAEKGEIDFFLEGQAFPVAPLLSLLPLPFEVSGTADTKLVVSGTAEKPQAELSLAVKDAMLSGIGLGDIDGEFTLAGSRFFVDTLLVQGQDHTAQAQGYLDLPSDIIGKLGVTNTLSRQEAGLNVAVQLPDGNASFLSIFFPDLVVEQGDISGQFDLSGTWSAPKVTGTVKMANAVFEYPGVGRIEDVHLAAAFEPGVMLFDRLTGTMGDGIVSMSGVLQLEGLQFKQLDVKLEVDNVEYVTDMFSGVFDGIVTAFGPLEMPTIAGHLAVKSGKAQLKLPAAADVGFDANLDLQLETFDDIVVRGFGIDLMLAGDVHLGGTVASPALDGKITATRGDINYLGIEFTLVHGVAEFLSSRGMIPNLNIRGESTVNGVDVTFLIQGTADNLSTTFRSDPEVSDEDLAAMLGWSEAVSSLLERSDANGKLDEAMARLIEAELSRQFVGDITSTFQSALHLDDLQIKPSFMGKSIQVEFGKYVLDDVYITYARKLQELSQEEWGIEYRLNSNVVLEGSLDSSGERRLELKGKFSF